jgi:hypothetical protein
VILITTTTLASAQATISLTSIPSTYDDLVLVVSLRSTADNANGSLAFNSGGLYTRKRFLSTGTAQSASTAAVDFQVNTSVSTSDTFSSGAIYIASYKGSVAKGYSATSLNENNANLVAQSFMAGLWDQTAAINSITLTPGAGNFAIGSMVSLYGIARGSDGIVTVS